MSTHLLLTDEDGHRRIESRTEGDGRRTLDLELVHHALGPLGGPKHLDLGADEANGMRLGDGILEFPPLLRLVGERDKLLAGLDGEDAEVLVLGAVLKLLGPFPSGKVRSAGGEADLYDVGKRKLLEQLRALGLEDADASRDGVGEETAIGAVLVRSSGHFWCLEGVDRVIIGGTTNKTEALLCADCGR